jgi:hypothetical protein
MGMLRALRRHRQARFLGRHRQRVLRWAVGAARGGRPRTPETVERITRGEAARHGACCKGHKEWERLHNLAWVEQEFPDDWDTEGRGVVSRLAPTDRTWFGESDRDPGVIGVGECERIGMRGWFGQADRVGGQREASATTAAVFFFLVVGGFRNESPSMTRT